MSSDPLTVCGKRLQYKSRRPSMRLSGLITCLLFSTQFLAGACTVDVRDPEDIGAVEQEVQAEVSYYCENGSATDTYGSCAGSTLAECRRLVEEYAKYTDCFYMTGAE
jgi:hypothetical protein